MSTPLMKSDLVAGMTIIVDSTACPDMANGGRKTVGQTIDGEFYVLHDDGREKHFITDANFDEADGHLIGFRRD